MTASVHLIPALISFAKAGVLALSFAEKSRPKIILFAVEGKIITSSLAKHVTVYVLSTHTVTNMNVHLPPEKVRPPACAAQSHG